MSEIWTEPNPGLMSIHKFVDDTGKITIACVVSYTVIDEKTKKPLGQPAITFYEDGTYIMLGASNAMPKLECPEAVMKEMARWRRVLDASELVNPMEVDHENE